MNAQLDRVLSEDESARAGVERAAATVRERIETERVRIGADREAHLRLLAAKVDEAVARILADAEHDVAERREHRIAWMREHAAHADDLIDAAARAFADIIREGPRKKTL